jgi:hypothetical protein
LKTVPQKVQKGVIFEEEKIGAPPPTTFARHTYLQTGGELLKTKKKGTCGREQYC